MSRTLFAVATAVMLVAALPSFAVEHGPENQTARQLMAGAAGGGGITLAVGATAPAATVPNEKFATGEAVMVTPDEVVLHTANGMRKFAVSAQTDETTVPTQGERVTVGYVPEHGTVQILAARSTATDRAPMRVAEVTAPAMRRPAQKTMSTAKPVDPAPATPVAPAAAPAVATNTHRVTRLPKTASDRPLILFAGLLAVAAAGTLHLALRA